MQRSRCEGPFGCHSHTAWLLVTAGVPAERIVRQGRKALAMRTFEGRSDPEQPYRHGRILRKIERMTHAEITHPKITHPNTVVVGVDSSASSRGAVGWAAEYAHACGSTLVSLHAGVASGTTLSDAVNLRSGRASGAHARARSTLATARVVAQSVAPESLTIDTVLESDSPAEALTEHAAKARLIVLGSHDQGPFARSVFGSVSTVVASNARCPIVVVPEKYTSAGGPVVVGLDRSPHDDAVLEAAFDQAARLHTRVHAVHACEGVDAGAVFSENVERAPHLDLAAAAKRWLDERVGSWAQKYPSVQASTSIVQDYPSRALLGCARHAQLIVVGARSRGALSPLVMGSTSRAVLHHTKIPTMIVPAR